MKRYLLFFVLIAGVLIAATDQGKFPQAQISNGLIKATLYLPDPETGYYRATRFDWSGVISSLEFKEHQYFGQWFEKYSSDLHDAIMGPVEEFTPVGFDKARSGEAFLKPGVGILVRPDEKPYSPFRLYQILNHGTWRTREKADEVEFVQVLQDGGYSYEYRKVVKLVPGKPQLTLTHVLKNTGREPMATSVYNHNFFVIDNSPTGPDFRVSFVFDAGGTFQGTPDVVKFRKNQMFYLRELVSGENIYCGGITGLGNSPDDYDIRIENIKTGAGVRIRGDRSLEKLVFWACPTTLCPEPYIPLQIAPGHEIGWSLQYDFYILDRVNQ